jgi:hypothetical protein
MDFAESAQIQKIFLSLSLNLFAVCHTLTLFTLSRAGLPALVWCAFALVHLYFTLCCS